MFDDELPKPKEPVDYTGLKIVAMVAPVFFLVTFLYNADAALTVCIVLAMTCFAIKLHWQWRKHIWFWVICALIVALHIPLVFMVRWPYGHGPTLAFTMPLGIADFLIVSGALRLAEKVFSKTSGDEDY